MIRDKKLGVDYAEELMMISRTLPDQVSIETCRIINDASEYIKFLERSLNMKRNDIVEG